MPESTAMLSSRRRMATIVRLSEKRILRGSREQLALDWPTEGIADAVAGLVAVSNKRERAEEGKARGKKVRK